MGASSTHKKHCSVTFFNDSYTKIQQDATLYQHLLFHILNEAQHVSGDTPPIIRSLKLHSQPLVLHTWKVVGRVVAGSCQVADAT
jgi:hypothetical protein